VLLECLPNALDDGVELVNGVVDGRRKLGLLRVDLSGLVLDTAAKLWDT
jgi:hypothetical protein